MTPETRSLFLGRPRWPANLTTARRPRQAERLLALLDAHGANVERFYLEPFGLEQRTPLRDPDLVELALALPDWLLQQGEESRVVLRAAIRGLVPESVRKRSGKANFSILIERGLAPDRLGWANEMIRSPDALWRGIVEPAAVERWLRGEFLDDSDRIGLLNTLYGELWRLRRIGKAPGSVLLDQ